MTDPKYRRIAEALRQKIENGDPAPGQRLPTENELIDQHGVSRNTIRDAVKWLISRGLVETRPGQGTFVTDKITPYITTLTEDPETGFGGGEGISYISEATTKGRNPTFTDPQVEVQLATAEIASELRLDKNTPVVSRHQRRYIDGTPWSLQTSFYPMDLVDSGARLLMRPGNIEPGAVRYLEESVGVEHRGYRDRITVRPPNRTESIFFVLPDDGRVAVFVTHRTAFDKDGKPFRLTTSVFPADRNQFVIKVGDVPTQDEDRV